jgi:hypothetical protein
MKPNPTESDVQRSKYRAIPTDCAAGHAHASKLEAGRCDQLHELQADGKLSRLEQQPEFPFIEDGATIFTYRADFSWFTQDCRVIEDVKGMRTPIYRLKKKLIEARYSGVVITEWPVRKRKARKRKVAA